MLKILSAIASFGFSALIVAGVAIWSLSAAHHQTSDDPTVSRSAELQSRDALIRSVQALIEAEAVHSLEALASEFRDTEVRTDAGIPKLTLFHIAVGRMAAAARDDLDQAGWILNTLSRWRQRYPASPTAVLAETTVLHEILGTAAEPSRLKQVSLQRQSAALGLLAQARDRLDERADDLASDPHFFVVRIELGALLGEPLSHLGALADQGLRRYPRYTQLYFTTLDTILAADGVTPQDLEQLSRRSAADHADESRFGIYARLVWHVVERTYPGDPAFLQEIDWDRFRLGMSAVLGTYPDAWNVNNFAYISCLAADSSATSRLLATIKEQPILEAWRGRDAYDACRNWVDVASVSPQGQ